jgi:hypothetical protein
VQRAEQQDSRQFTEIPMQGSWLVPRNIEKEEQMKSSGAKLATRDTKAMFFLPGALQQRKRNK